MGPPEVFEPFANREADRKVTYRFRSSWLASSLRALRSRSLVDAYRAKLPAPFHPFVIEGVAGQWLPIEVAVAHYEAIDALGIAPRAAFEMGAEVQTHAQSIVAQLVLRASRTAGVTPWTIFRQFRKLWDRTWSGGDISILKHGPKEAEVQIWGWSVAPSMYVRHAMRGALTGVTQMFCERVYVRELPAKCTGTSLAYHFAWA